MNKELLDNVINIFQNCADLLYQENLSSAYRMMPVIFSKMEELIEGMDEKEQHMIQGKLQQMLNAMEDGDSVLIADTIQYELLEVLHELYE